MIHQAFKECLLLYISQSSLYLIALQWLLRDVQIIKKPDMHIWYSHFNMIFNKKIPMVISYTGITCLMQNKIHKSDQI